ncbi:MAG: hypothetical protein AAGM67_20840, partial [Bacteroidota bacterium]
MRRSSRRLSGLAPEIVNDTLSQKRSRRKNAAKRPNVQAQVVNERTVTPAGTTEVAAEPNVENSISPLEATVRPSSEGTSGRCDENFDLRLNQRMILRERAIDYEVTILKCNERTSEIKYLGWNGRHNREVHNSVLRPLSSPDPSFCGETLCGKRVRRFFEADTQNVFTAGEFVGSITQFLPDTEEFLAKFEPDGQCCTLDLSDALICIEDHDKHPYTTWNYSSSSSIAGQ